MITREQQTSWYEHHLRELELPNDDIDWLERIRRHARATLGRQPILNRKLEAWRYSSVEKLLNKSFSLPPLNREISANYLEPFALPNFDAYRLVFYNGMYLPHLADSNDLPAGVTTGSLRAGLATEPEKLSRYLGQVANGHDNLFTALNDALIQDGLLLHIQEDVKLDRPIQIIHISEGLDKPVMIQPRHLIVLETGAEVTLVEHYVGNASSDYFHNNLVEIVLGKNANLEHHRFQNEAETAHHLSSLYLRQYENSCYKGTTLSYGGTWARTEYNTLFTGERAECDLGGLYLVGDQQLNDFHLDIRHALPNCASREHFKGIAHGQGRAVFDGRILVDRQAQHSDAQLKNDNLMLSRKAEIDTKPQLEIYADDVKCSHGTTIGQIEPEQLFYLRSRGISTGAAFRMLSQGFAGEMINRVKQETVREYAYEKLAASLDNMAVGE